jgi:hypothetical protein
MLTGFSCSGYGGSPLFRHGRTALPAYREHLPYRDRVEGVGVYAGSLRATSSARPLPIAQRVSEMPRRRRKHPPGMLIIRHNYAK